MVHAFAASVVVALLAQGSFDPSIRHRSDPPKMLTGASVLIDTGVVKAYIIAADEITTNSPTIITLDDGSTVFNAGDSAELILIGDNPLEILPGWMVAMDVIAGGSGHSAKSCSVTCGTVGTPPVQYFACCYTDAEGVARCLCRQPGQPDLDCTQGGAAATECSTSN